MPVRVEVQLEGKRLEYQRYWLEAGSPVEVNIWFLRGSLPVSPRVFVYSRNLVHSLCGSSHEFSYATNTSYGACVAVILCGFAIAKLSTAFPLWVCLAGVAIIALIPWLQRTSVQELRSSGIAFLQQSFSAYAKICSPAVLVLL